MKSYGIHWFRRDLRIAGNTALQKNWEKSEGRVLGVFCFDKKFLSRKDFSANRFQFFLETLKNLKEELREMGSDLLFLDIGPEDAFKELMTKLKEKPRVISWGRDYEPFAVKRDKKVKAFFESKGVETLVFRDHLLIEPEELSKPDGSGYQVYSPFAKKWRTLFQEEKIQQRILVQKKSIANFKKKPKKVFSLKWSSVLDKVSFPDFFESYLVENKKHVQVQSMLSAFLCKLLP